MKTMKTKLVLLISALGLAIHQGAHAQAGSTLVASVIAGGGDENSTIGQWDAGLMTSGTPALLGGFWNTVEVPWLRIQRTGGSVLVAWPASFIGFQLEQSSGLGDVILAGAPWQAWRAPSWEEIATAEAKDPPPSDFGGQRKAEIKQP